MSTPPNTTPESHLHQDVHLVSLAGRQIFLIGTAHVSQESADLVHQVIDELRPDAVCLELDEKRYQSLAHRKKWELLDLKEIMRRRQLATLLINLLLASYQKKLGDKLGVQPGSELLNAARQAEELNIPVALCDRDVRITMRRAWRATPWYRKMMLLATLLAGMFDRSEISEADLRELRNTDLLSELMAQLGRELPELKEVLIDERDTYLAEKIKATSGDKLVAVVGAGHVAGLKKALAQDRQEQMATISRIPPAAKTWKALAWAVPAIILSALAYIAISKGMAVAGQNLIYWILANGIPAAIGAALALAHPLTIAGAFVAAPVTSLTPVIGAGYVTAFLQANFRPPLVVEFERVLDDMNSLGGWWRNRLLRIFLAFILPAIGSMIGTWVGGYEILSNVF
ncbi:TraB/GumN family protein [Desulfurivibrio alkaliphilus]|uniref:TraB family protein n=1 Tax=Desulfurivibrio alkaliphilus (strain DSM 19089 / UNIQEM U267 / AHT2) TaxID=589865 RepID=D6Z2Y5_DESAT|nr:TraB/GumN family protein [Desulfurivibrio alkaliphilus]ADH85910.1 TraB family protein [Desulfurivibrio alkaliphilus AHT 2]